jgi:hypothetical protein
LSSRGRTWVGVAAGIVGGAIGGGVVAFVIVASLRQADADPRALPARAATQAPREDKPGEPPRSSGANQRRVQQLEERLGKLEEASDEARHSAEDVKPPEPPPTRAEYVASQQKLIAEHRQEATDPQWATSTKRAFEEDLARAKAQGTTFELAELDCRTTSCVLTAAWNTREEALSQYEYLFHYPTRASCARQVLVSEEANAAGKFEASIVYDCTDWRADGAVLGEALDPPLFQAQPSSR